MPDHSPGRRTCARIVPARSPVLAGRVYISCMTPARALNPLLPIRRRDALRLRDTDAKLEHSAGRDELRALLADCAERIGQRQDRLFADGRFALLVVLQGRDASGKDSAIKSVFGEVDPQGLYVASFGVPTKLEARHDFLWRVHQHVPARGLIGVFNRSHYEDVVVPRVRRELAHEQWTQRYRAINDFERMLSENGTVILKFFLHMSKAEQRRQLQERIDDPEKNWKFRLGDLDDRARWPAFTAAFRDAIRVTSTSWAPWFVVPSDDKWVRNCLIAQAVADTLERMDLRYPRLPGEQRGLRVK